MDLKKIIFIIIGFFLFADVAYTQSDKALGSFSGTVYAGINKLPKGNLYILENNKTGYSITQSTEILNGKFQIKTINSGNYILYVIPELNYDFLFFPKYIPTYFGETYYWKNALNKAVNKNNLNIQFNLLSFRNPFYGTKNISGNLKFSKGTNAIENLPVSVILLNDIGEPMDFRIADEKTGKYVFENLPDGVYYVHPEIPGLKTSDFKIEIKREKSSYEHADFFVNNKEIKVEKQTQDIVPVISNNFLKVFLKKDFNYPVICELIDLSGRSVIKKICYSDEISLSTSGLAANIYILKIKTYDNSPVKTTKVFIRNY
ncbi:MAG: hypothetical protein GXO80_11815 [Chlorobi bacterium]|nr:hypothetical protein [Chlorobiota bacterium]